MNVETVRPYKDERDKTSQVEQMFDSIAKRYDLMNSLMSFGQHKRWRDKALKSAIKNLSDVKVSHVLDVATGTGDVAFRLHELLPEAVITGIDLSEKMLEVARLKLENTPGKNLMTFGKADSLLMPFRDDEFDLLTVAYGVRNFSDLHQGLKEMRRVLKPQGVICIIELSTPRGILTKPLYNLYSGKIIPIIGKRMTGDERAYSYLPESIAACPQGEEMAALMEGCGFRDVMFKKLSFGAVTFYLGR